MTFKRHMTFIAVDSVIRSIYTLNHSIIQNIATHISLISLNLFLSLLISIKLFRPISLHKSSAMQRQARSSSSQAMSILSGSGSLTHLQVSELQKSISDLIHQNKKLHYKILQFKPEFTYQLYKISEFQAISKSFGKGLLQRQLDRLLQEKNYLDRELSELKFQEEEGINEKEKRGANEIHHYELLKNIWRKGEGKKYEGTQEHLSELNLMVTQVKSSIQSLVRFESNESQEFEETYVRTFKILHERNRECQKCQEYKGKIESLTAKLEKTQEKLSKISDENISFLEQINLKDDKLKKANRKLLRDESELKSRITYLEQELIKKDQLTKQIKRDPLPEGVFINLKEQYEVVIKSSTFDMSQYQKYIDTPLSNLMAAMVNQMPTHIYTDQGNKDVAFSKSTAEELNQERRQEERNELVRIGLADQHPNHSKSDKIRGEEILELQPANRRYARASKRASRGSSSQHEQGAGSSNSHRNRMNIYSIDVQI